MVQCDACVGEREHHSGSDDICDVFRHTKAALPV
jgi:hypothetical protein